MKSAGELFGVAEALGAVEAAAQLKETAKSQTLIERLELLQAQILTLNAALQEMVDDRSSLRQSRPRRRSSAAAELARFRKQARKLSEYAPS